MAPERKTAVVVPALNEERVIGLCLQALSLQDVPKDSFEVVVVDNGSTDRTVEIARSFSGALNLTVLVKPGVRISALRNFGVSRSRGEVLAFLDADCVAPPGWLKTAQSLLGRDGVGAVGAHYKVPDDSSWVGRTWFGGLELEKQGEIDWIPAGDMVLSRATFERVGGFDESISTNEDCELCERVRACGLSVVGDASAAVVHLGTPRTLGHFYRKVRWHATDGLRVFVRSLPKITNPRPLLLAAYTLLCVAGAAVGAVAAVWTRSCALALVCAAALPLPAVLLGLRAAAKKGRWNDLGAWIALYFVYGLARAHALVRVVGRRDS